MQDRPEEGGPGRFGDRYVPAVLDLAGDLDQRPLAGAKAHADGVGPAENLLGEGLVDDRHQRRPDVVVPGEVAAGEQPSAEGAEITRRDLVDGRGLALRQAEVRRLGAEDHVRGLIEAERQRVAVAGRRDARQPGCGCERAPLERRAACSIVAGQPEVEARHRDAARLEPERRLQGAREPAQRHHAGGDQQAAEGHLRRQQEVAQRPPPRRPRPPMPAAAPCPPVRQPAGRSAFERLVGVGAQGLARRRDAEQQPADERGREGEGEDAGIRVDLEPHRKIERRTPLAEQPQENGSQATGGGAAEQREQRRLGQQLAQDAAAPGADRQPDGKLAMPVRGARGEQAGQVGAGGEQRQAGERHDAAGKGPHGITQRAADQAGLCQA